VVPSPALAAPSVSIPLLAPAFTLDGGESLSTRPAAGLAKSDASTSGAGKSQADLLLLDVAMAEFDDDDSTDRAAPLGDRRTSDHEHDDDYALAAVFENESCWWSL
jgi:hypothetical protein